MYTMMMKGRGSGVEWFNPDHEMILDADYISSDDADLIRRHRELQEAIHHLDDAPTNEVLARVRAARRYIRRNCRKKRTAALKPAILVKKMLAGAALFFLWAVVLAMLVS